MAPYLAYQLRGKDLPSLGRHEHGQHQAVFGVPHGDGLPGQLDRDHAQHPDLDRAAR
jgi:hypothetical protein